MAKYRNRLPQLDGGLFITDGGIETSLIFLDGLTLPYFAAFVLLRDADGRVALERYFNGYAEIARRHGVGCLLESPTWRANPDWAAKLGYTPEQLDAANRQAIDMLVALRAGYESAHTPVVISGCLGPRGDGYDPSKRMSIEEAADYHLSQIETFHSTQADLVTAITMNYVEEAIGVAGAARAAGMPAVISFTVETDGRLPTGQPLGEAIEAVDAATNAAPAYYMINCAHPDHFQSTIDSGEPWTRRLRGLRANASRRSHAELNDSPDLDAGNPQELGRQHAELRRRLPQLSVLGGCCGTDHRHIDAICTACL